MVKKYSFSPVTKEGGKPPAKKAPAPKPFQRPGTGGPGGQKPGTATPPAKKPPAPAQKPPAAGSPGGMAKKPPAPAQKPPAAGSPGGMAKKPPAPAQKPPAAGTPPKPSGVISSGMPPEAVAAMEAARKQVAEAQKRAAEAEKAKPKTYVVQPGDSLSKIAKNVLGDAKRWPEIFELNKDKIKDPNLIYPGQELRLP